MKYYRCENCGKVLFTLNGDGLVEHAGGLVDRVDGVCACGHGYHYNVTERLLARILERYNQREAEVMR